MQVLFDTRGQVRALFRPATERNAPQLDLRPARGQRVAWLEVPAGLEKLSLRELHATLTVKSPKDKPILAKRLHRERPR